MVKESKQIKIPYGKDLTVGMLKEIIKDASDDTAIIAIVDGDQISPFILVTYDDMSDNEGCELIEFHV
jgi:hypothetical protein